MKIDGVSFYFRFLDLLLFPLMWILSGFKLELPQETHPWHMQEIDEMQIPKDKLIEFIGNDNSKFSNKDKPFFHVPVLGGWRDYIVLEAENYGKYWRIGWILKYHNSNQKTDSQIQKLKIKSPYIKLLSGIDDSKKYFFAVSENGNFADLKIVGSGTLGDGKFRNVRLF